MSRFFGSIRFQVWLLFIGFTGFILIFLYLNQIIALPGFYNFVKTQESVQTINYLKSNWKNPDLPNIIISLAKEQDMLIQLWYLSGDDGIPIVYEQDPNETYISVSIKRNLSSGFKQKLIESNTGVVLEPYETNNRSILMAATYIGTPTDVKGYIIINNYIEPLANTTNILKRQFFFNSTIILFLAFIVSAFVVVRISNPIIRISRNASKLATGDFNMKISPSDYAEIQILAINLNRASSEIAKTENLRKDLIANVSHDLKTPLTVIKAYAEMIRDLSGDIPEKREKHLQVIMDEADRLNTLVMDLLDTSKLQSGVASVDAERFNLSSLLQNVIKRFDYFTEDGKFTIKTEIENNVWIKADSAKLGQAIYNLLNNAINHTGDDGMVTIRLFIQKGGKCRVEVSDTGNGIPKNEIPLIWERYYKGEKSQNHKRTTVGTGLGLSIVKGVFVLHGFAYGVNSVVKKGSTFWFEAPCSSPPQAELQ